jgi:hypothetical protein
VQSNRVRAAGTQMALRAPGDGYAGPRDRKTTSRGRAVQMLAGKRQAEARQIFFRHVDELVKESAYDAEFACQIEY